MTDEWMRKLMKGVFMKKTVRKADRINVQACDCSSSYHPLKLSWRIGVPIYEKDQVFKNLVKFLCEYKKVVDEVAFFETLTHHLYFPLNEIQRRVDCSGTGSLP